MDVHVDEAGGDDHAGGIEDFRTRRVQIGADGGDEVAVEQDVRDGVVVRGGVHNAAVLDEEAGHVYDRILSRTAMRTAMPLPT